MGSQRKVTKESLGVAIIGETVSKSLCVRCYEAIGS